MKKKISLITLFIRWSAIRFKRIIQGRTVEESGILNYKERLFFRVFEKRISCQYLFFQYQGKHYLNRDWKLIFFTKQ